MLKISLKIYISFIQKKGFFILLFIGIFISMLGVFFTFSRGMTIYEEGKEFYDEARTIAIFSQEPMLPNDIKKVYEKFFGKDTTFDIYQFIASGNNTDIIGYYSNSDESLGIPFGRFFSPEELNGGRCVLLSDAFYANAEIAFLEDMLGQSIKLEGSKEEYQVIGRYNSTIVKKLLLSEEVCIPFKTYVDTGIPMNEIRMILKEKPTQRELLDMEEFFQNSLQDCVVQLPSTSEKGALTMFLKSILSHFMIFTVFCITIFNIFRYWIKTNLKRFYIYYICGCSSRKILMLLSLNTCYIYLVPSLFSLLVYKGLESYFYSFQFLAVLKTQYLCAIYVFLFICMLLAVLGTGMKQTKKFRETRGMIS